MGGETNVGERKENSQRGNVGELEQKREIFSLWMTVKSILVCF